MQQDMSEKHIKFNLPTRKNENKFVKASCESEREIK